MDTSSYITTYMPIAGWKAILYCYTDEYGGFWEPWETSPVAFRTKARAAAYARGWAAAEGYRYVENTDSDEDAPDESVAEQLGKILGDVAVIDLNEGES